jgi:hypothetical protein
MRIVPGPYLACFDSNRSRRLAQRRGKGMDEEDRGALLELIRFLPVGKGQPVWASEGQVRSVFSPVFSPVSATDFAVRVSGSISHLSLNQGSKG